MEGELGRLIESVVAKAPLDGAAVLVERIGRGLPARIAERSHALLGHPVHPALTDLPIGFWTSAWTLDLLPGRDRTAAAARTLIGLGLLSTVPTVVTGLGDAAGMSREGRRTAALHASLNVGATVALACSWWLRRGEAQGRARTIAQLGAVLATAGAAIGGHLAFPEGAGDDDGDDGDRGQRVIRRKATGGGTNVSRLDV